MCQNVRQQQPGEGEKVLSEGSLSEKRRGGGGGIGGGEEAIEIGQ